MTGLLCGLPCSMDAITTQENWMNNIIALKLIDRSRDGSPAAGRTEVSTDKGR